MRDRLLCKALLLLCLFSACFMAAWPLQAADPLPNPQPNPQSEAPAIFLPAAAQPSAYEAHAGFEICLPVIARHDNWSERSVESVPVVGPPVTRPAAVNPDINLAVRGYTHTDAALGLVDFGGPTDSDAPQLAALFDPPRLPPFVDAHCVHDWNWGCGPDGCLGNPIGWPSVTLVTMAAATGEPIHIPGRRAEIYSGGYIAMVLYADTSRITLKYGREDDPATGYLVHLEELTVAPALLRRYEELNAAGRGELPALRNGEVVGWVRAGQVMAAVRDTGSFLDPRSRKDWWQGY